MDYRDSCFKWKCNDLVYFLFIPYFLFYFYFTMVAWKSTVHIYNTVHYICWILFRFHVNTCYVSLYTVSVSDVEVIREGHQSEVLLSIADEFPANRCFTLVFRGRRGNLDLVAESAEEAQSWIRGMRKLIENLENMGEREKLDQYPSGLCFQSYTSSAI